MKTIVKDGSYTAPKEGWTCYHCGVTFRKPGAARDHFGEIPRDKPKCQYHDLDVEKLEAKNAELLKLIPEWQCSQCNKRFHGPTAFNLMCPDNCGGTLFTIELILQQKLITSEKKVEELEAELFTSICDEPDCELPVCCGTPTGSGYRNTCSRHRP